MDEMVRMQAGDRKTVRAPFGLLARSKVIMEMCSLIGPSLAGDKNKNKDKVRDNGKDKDKDKVELLLPLHGIGSTEVLLKLLLWAEYHKEDEEPSWVVQVEPISGYQMELQVHDWDKAFLRDQIEIVCALMEAADYLDIPWLFKLAAYKIALYCRRSKEAAAAGLKHYQDKIQDLAMFDWMVESSEQTLKAVAPEKIRFDKWSLEAPLALVFVTENH